MILTREILHKSSQCEMLCKKMVIYKIQKLCSKKIYIGKTARTLAERLKEHLRKSSVSYMDRAIRKHGIENFDVSIVAECENEDQLNELEKFYIAEFNCMKPNGYNLTAGGEGILGYKAPPELSQKLSEQRKGRPVPQKQREAISIKLKGREFTDEHRSNISSSKLGHPVSDATREKLKIANLGNKHSSETRQKMSKSCKTKRRVICVELKKIFDSISSASKWCGVSVGTIITACKSLNRTAGGYHWKYHEI